MIPQQGLYQDSYEHDACGVGMVVNIHGDKSHELVDDALKVLENMEHRKRATRQATAQVSWYRFPMSLFFCKEFPSRRKDAMEQDSCSFLKMKRHSAAS